LDGLRERRDGEERKPLLVRRHRQFIGAMYREITSAFAPSNGLCKDRSIPFNQKVQREAKRGGGGGPSTGFFLEIKEGKTKPTEGKRKRPKKGCFFNPCVDVSLETHFSF